MAKEPVAIQLRYLQTLAEVSAEKNSTILFPVPIEFLRGIVNRFEVGQSGRNPSGEEGGGSST
jgi:hypothetical protein